MNLLKKWYTNLKFYSANIVKALNRINSGAQRVPNSCGDNDDDGDNFVVVALSFVSFLNWRCL